MDILIFAFEIIGTVAFSVSGAMTGLKKNMDIFGVMILGVVTAIGGGVTRDLILGITPPGTFGHPVYAIVATVTAIITFLPAIRRLLTSNQHVHDFVLLILDSLGLGVFTVVGIQTAYSVSTGRGAFLVVFVGVITGVGGGVLRDVLAGEKPYIFVKHIYACASIVGAVFYVYVRGWILRYHLAVQQHRGGHCGRGNSFRHPPARRPFQMEPAQGGQIRSCSAAGAKRERREHAGDMISRSYLFNRKPARWLSVGWALIFVMRGLKWKCSDRLGSVGVNTGYERLINQHNRVGQISSAREIITILLACICRVRINKIVIDFAAY